MFYCVAGDGRGDCGFASPVLLGRNGECGHSRFVQDTGAVFAAFGADGIQLHAAGPERMEPRAAFSGCVAGGADGIALCALGRFLRVFPARVFACKGGSLAGGVFCNVQKPFAICAAGPGRSALVQLVATAVVRVCDFCGVPAGHLERAGAIADVGFRVSGDGEFAGRAAIGADDSFFCFSVLTIVCTGACVDGVVCGILEPNKSNDCGAMITGRIKEGK